MTDTFNPILGREQIKGWRLFDKRPSPEPGTALVLSGGGRPLFTIEQGDRLGTGELRWGSYEYCYRVDTSEHLLSFQCLLPCRTDAFEFAAEVQFTCSVNEPAMIVQRNVIDARRLLEPSITNLMRDMSRDYDLEESAKAEREIGGKLTQEVFDEGFEVSHVVLKLSLDAEAREYLRQKRKIQADKVLKLADINSQGEIQDAEQVHKERANQFELKMIEMKMKFYGPIIQSGNLELLALQLANNPNDLTLVTQMLNEQKQAANAHQLKMLQMLLNEDALEGSQLNDLRKRLLQGLGGLFDQALPAIEESSVPAARKLAPAGAQEDETISAAEFPEEISRHKDDSVASGD